MGYKIIQQSNNTAYDIYEFVVDTPADLNSLPYYVGAGSTVIILHGENNTLEVRMKSPSGDWVII